MKILQLISGALGQGGAERLVIDLSETMARKGHDVTICCFRKPSDEVVSNIDKSVKVHCFGKTKGLDLLLPFKIANYIKAEGFEVVNCHLPAVFPYLIWSLLVCKDVKFFYTIHNNPIDEESRKSMRMIRKGFAEKGKLTFVGISGMISDDFKKLYRLNSAVPVIYNGRKRQQFAKDDEIVKAEVSSYKKNEDTKVFIAVGRLNPQKNYTLLIEAFGLLKDENILLVVLGKDYDGFLERHKNDIPSNVHFLGGKNNVSDYLFNADCFIMSSLYEGLPISIIEAMSAGLPIVSTAVGGIPDIVKEGVNGFLSESLEVDDFVKTIRRFLSMSATDLAKMKEANKNEYNEKYTIERTAEQYLALYQRTV